ncbi:hypothetical protein [Gemmatimonas groenlandica]|uniref:Alpha/beta hydrolase n=1 Tax=Gemmatimonas groenlandica TaxID=2732249 RepID=A0A6M4IPV5_9BACT|nr:hypothetical protein [Gemmatimonas groenlandica]QJR35779.1 hypothetical protein HKW67_09770 [Gemmatimonas groenlandica]
MHRCGKTASSIFIVALLWPPPSASAQGVPVAPPPAPAPQQASPMVESTRLHERLTPRALGGTTRSFTGPAGKPVEIWIPDRVRSRDAFDVVVHFHGAAWLPEQAVAALESRTVAVVLNLGAGSGIYDRSFADPAAFDTLLATVTREVAAVTDRPSRVGRVTLVGFSAGHGAVRAILREPRHLARVDAVLLLDGMHTSYVPAGQVLAAGGMLDPLNLVSLTAFARAAAYGDKRMLITHSEIFPGTYASTTETADWTLLSMALVRKPVLKWGPRGMQQLSEVHARNFRVLGFAGTTAPDHIDQLHAMPELLKRLLSR